MTIMDNLLEKYNELMIKDIVNQKKKIIELEREKDKKLLANKSYISNENKFLYFVEIFGLPVCIITNSPILMIMVLLLLPYLILDLKINVDLKKNREKIKDEYEKNLKAEMQKYENILKDSGFNTIEEYNQKVENIASKIIENFDEWTEKHAKSFHGTIYLTINCKPIKQKEQLIICLHENIGTIQQAFW